eukprot:3530567-Karenia_brevis.AAC.1
MLSIIWQRWKRCQAWVHARFLTVSGAAGVVAPVPLEVIAKAQVRKTEADRDRVSGERRQKGQ